MLRMSLLQVDIIADLGIASRILDLLSVQSQLPSQLEIVRQGERLAIRVLLEPAPLQTERNILLKVRQLPGVMRAALLADQEAPHAAVS
jgi:hypothetical protein